MLDCALGVAIFLLFIQSIRASVWRKVAKDDQKENREFRSTIMERDSTIEFYEKVHRQWAGMLKQFKIDLMINGKIVQPLEAENTEEWPEELN